MRTEPKIAWMLTLSGLGLSLVMSTLQSRGVVLEPGQQDLTASTVFALLSASFLIWLHLGWVEGRKRGWGETMGGAIVIAGMLLAGGGIYVFRHPPVPRPVKVTIAIAPPVRSGASGSGTGVEDGAGTYGGSQASAEVRARDYSMDGNAEPADDTASRSLPRSLKELSIPSRGQKMAEAIKILQDEYASSHPNSTVPDTWMNDRLKKMGIAFQYQGTPTGFKLTPR